MALTTTSPAQTPKESATLVALGQWHLHGGHLALTVPLADAMTPKQRSIISGGFTTVSVLSVKLPRPGQEEDDDSTLPFYSVRCTVKFDAWEETYDVARLDEQAPKTALVKGFSDYGELCLKAELTPRDEFAKDLLARLERDGGTLFASLVVKQTSVEEAARIKEWLIQQQSGVMQGLFSHMLGELTLNQTLKVRVSVPPKPATLMPAANPPAPKPPVGKG